jgi:hypothetical protein
MDFGGTGTDRRKPVRFFVLRESRNEAFSDVH